MAVVPNLDVADVILLNVSRCWQDPTSLYLIHRHGIKAANPLILGLQAARFGAIRHLGKCFSLTIDPERLCQIRNG